MGESYIRRKKYKQLSYHWGSVWTKRREKQSNVSTVNLNVAKERIAIYQRLSNVPENRRHSYVSYKYFISIKRVCPMYWVIYWIGRYSHKRSLGFVLIRFYMILRLHLVQNIRRILPIRAVFKLTIAIKPDSLLRHHDYFRE